MEKLTDLELRSEWRLFRFQDGSIIDIAKIDFIATHPEKDDKYIIQVSGKQITLDKDQESKNLIRTWDLYLKNEEQNAEHTYLYEKEMSAMISILNKKLDFILANYTRVHKDVVPEYSLDENKKEG